MNLQSKQETQLKKSDYLAVAGAGARNGSKHGRRIEEEREKRDGGKVGFLSANLVLFRGRMMMWDGMGWDGMGDQQRMNE